MTPGLRVTASGIDGGVELTAYVDGELSAEALLTPAAARELAQQLLDQATRAEVTANTVATKKLAQQLADAGRQLPTDRPGDL